MTVGSKFSRRTVLKNGLAGAATLSMGLYAPHVLAQNKSLSIMVLGPDQKALEWLRGALADFKQQSGYDVEIRQSDWGSGFQKLLTATASGTMADVTMMGQVMTPAPASKGAFLAIDDRLADAFVLRDSAWKNAEVRLPPPGSRRVRRIDVRVDRLRKGLRGADIGEIAVLR